MQQSARLAYLGLRRGLQVAQAVAQPLSRQAELAVLLLDAGHTLEHHFIVLSGTKRRTCVSVSTYVHPCTCKPLWSRLAELGCTDTDMCLHKPKVKYP